MIEVNLSSFEEPKSLEDARDRLVIMSAEIESINIQLKSSQRRYATEVEQDRWIVRASDARRLKRAEVQWVQNWITRCKHKSALSPEDVSAGGLLLATLPILNTAAEQGLDENSQVIVDAVRGYVKNRFPAVGGLVTGTIALEEINAT